MTPWTSAGLSASSPWPPSLRLSALRAEWRGEREIDVHRAPESWPFDLPSWRALVRARPMGAVEAPFMGAAIIFSALEDTAATQALEVVFTGLASWRSRWP